MVQAVGTFHSWGWQINILLSVAGKKKKKHDRFKLRTDSHHVLQVRVSWRLIRQVTAPHAAGWATSTQHQSHARLVTARKWHRWGAGTVTPSTWRQLKSMWWNPIDLNRIWKGDRSSPAVNLVLSLQAEHCICFGGYVMMQYRRVQKWLGCLNCEGEL